MVAELAGFYFRHRTYDQGGAQPAFLTAKHQPGLLGRRLGSIRGHRKEIGRLGQASGADGPIRAGQAGQH
jgi:hypothetical protein